MREYRLDEAGTRLCEGDHDMGYKELRHHPQYTNRCRLMRNLFCRSLIWNDREWSRCEGWRKKATCPEPGMLICP